MAERRVGIIMHGVTGRMGLNQHLVRSILAIRSEGGLALSNGDRLMPDPILVGRNPEKVRALARAHEIERWSSSVAEALADPATAARGMAPLVDDPTHGPLRQIGAAPLLSRTPAGTPRPAPAPGQDTAAILAELGYSVQDVASLMEGEE